MKNSKEQRNVTWKRGIKSGVTFIHFSPFLRCFTKDVLKNKKNKRHQYNNNNNTTTTRTTYRRPFWLERQCVWDDNWLDACANLKNKNETKKKISTIVRSATVSIFLNNIKSNNIKKHKYLIAPVCCSTHTECTLCNVPFHINILIFFFSSRVVMCATAKLFIFRFI